MNVSSEECPICEKDSRDGELQENGDQLIGRYDCPHCETEFEITWEKADKNILSEGHLPDEDE